MFHANAWGLPYARVAGGSSLLMPGPLAPGRADHAPSCIRLAPDRLRNRADLVRERRAGPPTSFVSADTGGPLVAPARLCGGSAVPVSLQKAPSERHGIEIASGLGDDGVLAPWRRSRRHRPASGGRDLRYRGGPRSPPCQVSRPASSAPTGTALPHDRELGRRLSLEVRGPWVTGGYYRRRSTRRGSTTVGCAPVMSGTWRVGPHHPRDRTAPSGVHQVRG